VKGPAGAQVVVPAGALSAATPIAVAEFGSGAPALPAGVVPFGAIFAFTPHGTHFDAPVTITVPFDPALVPPGTQPVLYKTNPAMTGWAEVPGATVSGGTMTGRVRSFSGLVAGGPPPPPLEKGRPQKTWEVRELLLANNHVIIFRDDGSQDGGVLEKDYDFGVTRGFDPAEPLPELLPREFRATGRIFSSAGGGVYGVSGEAPNATSDAGVAGNLLFYSQSQGYRKRDADAGLRLVITQARIEGFDDQATTPLPCVVALSATEARCSTEMEARVDFQVDVSNDRLGKMFVGEGKLDLQGWRQHWKANSIPDFADKVRLWDESKVEFDPNVGNRDGSGVHLGLREPLTIPIDISAVNKDEKFNVFVRVNTFVFNGRPEGEHAYLGAFFRDPTRIDGDAQLIIEGIEPTDDPDPEPPSDDPSLPPECRGKPSAGTLAFLFPTFDVLEGAGPAGANLLIVRNGGSAGQVSATVTTSDGTATTADDYESVHTTVTFDDGEIAPQFVRIPLVYSPAAEGNKTFTVTLSDPTGCATLGQATSVVTILDDTQPLPPSQTFSLGGAVSGLLGSGLVLRDVLQQETVAVAGNGPFTFPSPRLDRSEYDVRVDAQPSNPLQACSVLNGTGTVSGGNVGNIAVTCTTLPPAGGLDSTFGDHGRAVTTVPYSPNLLRGRIGMALQSDGKILMVGGLKLLRLNTDGTPDGTFGTQGVVDVVFENGSFDTAMDVVVQADGKIVVAGTTSTTVVGSDNFALTRFDSRGFLDTTFGTGGHVTTDFFGSTDQVRRMVLQPDGKLIVVGSAFHPVSPVSGSTLFAIVRYDADGHPDPTFAVDGKTTDSPGQVLSFAGGVTIQSDGNIVVAGSTAPNGGEDGDTGVVRYLGDGHIKLPGTRDESFGPMSNGTLEAPIDQSVDVVIANDGTILTAVQVNAALTGTGNFGFGLGHIPATGVPPPRLPQPAITFTSEGDFPKAMLKQFNGQIVVVGQSGGFSTNPDMAIVRFDDSGFTPDSSFGTDGKQTIDFFGHIDSAEAVVQQPDRKLVVGGFARSGAGNVFVAVRLTP
jgi:uncharacterized delta-60 repeat protein